MSFRQNDLQYDPAAIVDFWFADIGDGYNVKAQHKIWYGGKKKTDDQIRLLFGKLVEKAIEGELQAWTLEPGSTMSLLLLLDQFTRNIYRGQAKAFCGDYRARNVVKLAIEKGFDTRLPIIVRSFFYMPLEHSELLEDQKLCVQLFEQLLQQTPSKGQATIGSSLSFARKHLGIIEKFGRFPHRNSILQRKSTQLEMEYLETGGARFGQ